MDFGDIVEDLTDLVDRMEKEYDENSRTVEFHHTEFFALKRVLHAVRIIGGHYDIS